MPTVLQKCLSDEQVHAIASSAAEVMRIARCRVHDLRVDRYPFRNAAVKLHTQHVVGTLKGDVNVDHRPAVRLGHLHHHPDPRQVWRSTVRQVGEFLRKQEK